MTAHAIQHLLKSRTDTVSLLNQIGCPCSHFRMGYISLLADLNHERTFFDCKIWHPLVFTLCGTGDSQWNAQHIFVHIAATCSGCLNVAVIRPYTRTQFHLIQAYYPFLQLELRQHDFRVPCCSPAVS